MLFDQPFLDSCREPFERYIGYHLDSEFYELCYMVDTLYDGRYYLVEDLVSAYFIYYDIKNQCSKEQFYKIIQDRIMTELYL